MWADSFNNIRAFAHLPRVQEIDDLIQAAKDKVIVGEATAQVSFDELVPKINAILAEVSEEVAEAGL
jgi:hypothetical protein